MRLPGLLLPTVFFLALGGLEVRHAVDRIEAERARRRNELSELVDRRQEQLAKNVSDRLGEGSTHATHLARSPAVRALLSSDDESRRLELERSLPPYLASFRGIDQISLLDAAGVERFRCERMGGGVAVLPQSLLPRDPRTELLHLAAEALPHRVAVSELLYDAKRVEVSEERRRVFHYVTPVVEGARRLGIVAVTVYATPILETLSGFEVLPGMTTWLLDEGGDVFAAQPTRAGQGTHADPPLPTGAREAVLAGQVRTELGETVVFARPTGKAPCSWLVSSVPTSTLEQETGELRWKVARTVARAILVLAIIALGTAIFVRASGQARRLRETERYLVRIRQESAKHRALMEAAADLILIVAPEREELRDTSPKARSVLGIPTADGPLQLDVLEPSFGPGALERIRDGIARASEHPGQPIVVASIDLRAKGGERMVADARCVGLWYDGEPLVEVALSDRTRELEMERKVQMGERLGSLGLLTAGVAHEINNPLEGMANYLSLLERSPADSDRERYLARVRAGLHRIRDIVGDLVRFARPEQGSGTADLARVVERVVSLAKLSAVLKGVDVQVEGLAEPMLVPGSEGRLEQVFLNLLLNAGRAVEGSGTVWLRADRTDSDRWRVDVEDDGPGIEAEDLPRIFDPFFTRSQGTGLGLSVSYGIVRAHGGELEAGNRPQGGARFTLWLPRLPMDQATPGGDVGGT